MQQLIMIDLSAMLPSIMLIITFLFELTTAKCIVKFNVEHVWFLDTVNNIVHDPKLYRHLQNTLSTQHSHSDTSRLSRLISEWFEAAQGVENAATDVSLCRQRRQ